MLRCNLGVLLAERGLRITKVSDDTGISRTTITALVNNASQGLQLETVNKLCLYLKVNPADFFLYHPSKITHRLFEADGKLFVHLDIEDKGFQYKVLLTCFARSSNESDCIVELFPDDRMSSSLSERSDRELEYNFGNGRFDEYYQSLPMPFKQDLEDSLLSELSAKLDFPAKAKKILHLEGRVHFR